MIKLTVDQIVLKRLKQAFPTPPNSAEKALQKYTTLLETLLTQAISLRRTPHDRLLNLYSISLVTLEQEGPRIGPKKTRLHKWLIDNRLSLIEVVERGNSITREKSKVKMTAHAKAADVFAIEASDSDSYRLRNADAFNEQSLVSAIAEHHYPGFNLEDWNSGKLAHLYDVVPVNRDSLERYLSWVLTKVYKVSRAKRDEYARHAQFILAITKHFEGLFPQRKIVSPFGRTYYSGINIQNINKLLRRAALAPAYEYDLNTSVCTWKLGLANDWLGDKASDEELKKRYLSLYLYVTNKTEFINTVRASVFEDSEKRNAENETDLIKSALTALSFGATFKETGWVDASGTRHFPAIKTIFRKDKDAGERFYSNDLVKDFKNAHDEIDEALYGFFRKETSNEDTPDFLKTKRGRVSRSKVVAWFYQQSETDLMNRLRTFITTKTRRKVLANIHDAVVLDGPLRSVLVDLTEHLRTDAEQPNPFIRVKATELEPFTNETIKEFAERTAHEQRIAAEAKAAAEYHAQA